MSNLEELYCGVDDFCQQFIPLCASGVINDCGELLAVKLTSENKDDRHPVKARVNRMYGWR
ncbi:hypothetical protein BB987_14930 [Photorhabdus temperata]|uniref:Transposase n=1 Tax=Photorhabdus khanii NC19 TaxID=1004151 RepID=W3VCV5_9GAMM|nr:hypothetical protein [Photorhabdus khanii]ETS33657.1 hypothetical protein PTE_00833 [Photorhabdus khanii NC19]OHV52242.1 hypothetical protein BB987_14930 [Photorhabdus temperata]